MPSVLRNAEHDHRWLTALRLTGRLGGFIALVFFSLAQAGCKGEANKPVALLCSADAPRVRRAVSAIEAGLAPGGVEAAFLAEQGRDGKETVRRLQARRPALFVVLGTPALLLLAAAEKRTPVVFALVADPYFTGVADDPRRPDLHRALVTGLASPPPVAAALEQGARLLGSKAWGLLYDPQDGAAVEVAERFTTETRRLGLTPLLETGRDAASDQAALQRLLSRGAKVLYLPPAATASRYAGAVLALGRARQVIVVNSHPETAGKGALLTVALDYRRLGEETAALAKRILAGENPGRIPITESTPLIMEVDETLLNYWSGYPAPRRQ
ncbi:MAG: hypothetical protein FJ128_13885 [Deltaproteobacteria bacterium]|nr:hypothetical protein [Deltaproteobacteria bacterium]